MTIAANSSRLDDPFGLVGRVLAEKFRAESVVARGGFGVLYKGTHLTLQRPIAIKVLRTSEKLHGSMRDAVRAAFEREAQMVARLSHPAIVHVIEYGVEPAPDAPLLWMVLEWIEGKPLSVVLRERNGQRYTPAEAMDLMRPVLQALAHAHDEGLAHRDLKPANIMVTPTRRGPSVKLIDFGIAKAMDEGEAASDGDTQTQSVMAVYSPRYAAPEQVGRARTGPWTDVHALGLILTEMLVGHPAYTSPASESTALMAEVLNPQRPTPGRVGIDAGGWEAVDVGLAAVRE
ncbi:MAG: serine/threonine-protein kinase, partial [Deltaproteobacteria bacterium]